MTEELIARYSTVDSPGECIGTLLSRLIEERRLRRLIEVCSGLPDDIIKRRNKENTEYALTARNFRQSHGGCLFFVTAPKDAYFFFSGERL